MNQQLFLLILVIILTVTFMVESQIGYIADLIPEVLVSNAGIATFVFIGAVFVLGGILILQYLKTRNFSRSIHIGVTITQYVLIAIMVFVIGEVLITSQYHSVSILISSTISYGLWAVMAALLCKALISWIRATGKKKRNLVVFAFALAMIFEALTGVTVIILDQLEWSEVPPNELITSSDVAVFARGFTTEPLSTSIELVYNVAAGVAYVLTWIGIVILLRPYIARRIGKIAFYAIMVAAMVYYQAYYPLFILGYYEVTEEQSEQEVINNTLIIGFSDVFSGIIFGAAFLAVARTLRKHSALKGYMMLAAYGYILLYIAGSSYALQLAYPPYGLASVAFTGLSTYLIYVGLYSAAVCVSQDYQIRDSIRKSAAKEIKFLEDMGTAQMQQELESKVLTINKKVSDMLAEETGVKPSLDEGDMKEYLHEVLKEIENFTTKTKK